MKNLSTITIIVPVYNVEKYLEQCVSSLTHQTIKDIEIILVDDDSPDNCPVICDEWAAKDSRIRVIHKNNEGLGMACNSGLEVATGEYVAFCDSDDWIEPDMYKDLYDVAKRENADVVYSGIRKVTDSGIVTPMHQVEKFKIHSTASDISNFAMGMIASGPAFSKERETPMSAKIAIYKREFLVKNNIHFESERKLISEDLFFNLDILEKSECVVEVPNVYYNYRVNQASLSSKIRTDRFEKAKEMRKELLKRYSEFGVEFPVRADRMFIGYTRQAVMQICQSWLPYKEKKRLIREIADDKVWDDIESHYPVTIMPYKHRLVYGLMRRKIVGLLMLLSKFV